MDGSDERGWPEAAAQRAPVARSDTPQPATDRHAPPVSLASQRSRTQKFGRVFRRSLGIRCAAPGPVALRRRVQRRTCGRSAELGFDAFPAARRGVAKWIRRSARTAVCLAVLRCVEKAGPVTALGTKKQKRRCSASLPVLDSAVVAYLSNCSAASISFAVVRPCCTYSSSAR